MEQLIIELGLTGEELASFVAAAAAFGITILTAMYAVKIIRRAFLVVGSEHYQTEEDYTTSWVDGYSGYHRNDGGFQRDVDGKVAYGESEDGIEWKSDNSWDGYATTDESAAEYGDRAANDNTLTDDDIADSICGWCGGETCWGECREQNDEVMLGEDADAAAADGNAANADDYADRSAQYEQWMDEGRPLGNFENWRESQL
jgi:hypothetical protein